MAFVPYAHESQLKMLIFDQPCTMSFVATPTHPHTTTQTEFKAARMRQMADIQYRGDSVICIGPL